MPAKRQPTSTRDALRAYALVPAEDERALMSAARLARDLGFSSVMALGARSADPALQGERPRANLQALIAAVANLGLEAGVCVRLDRVAATHALPREAPHAFRTAVAGGLVVDPRKPFEDLDGLFILRRGDDDAVVAGWTQRLSALKAAGASRFAYLSSGPAARALAARLRAFGFSIDEVALANDRPLASTHPAMLCHRRGPLSLNEGGRRAILAAAAITAPGWVMEAGFEAGLEASVRALNQIMAGTPAPLAPRALTSVAAPLSIAVGAGALLARNRAGRPLPWPPATAALAAFGVLEPIDGLGPDGDMIAPGETLLFKLRAPPDVVSRRTEGVQQAADPAARVVIANVEPMVDGGAYAVKQVVGEPLKVTANIFTDGHTPLAAEFLTKADDEPDWTRTPMTAEPNDVWRVEAHFTRLGRHDFAIEAWVDVWGGFASDFAKKRAAGENLALELLEARVLIEAAKARASGPLAKALRAVLKLMDKAAPDAQVEIVLSDQLANAMARADDRPFLTRSPVQPVEAERIAARYSSWYELFPRSQTEDSGRLGGFVDVIDRLPHIAAMGFDTLYFPPIHPIGRINRKGRNNTLTPSREDVGSPYAIGSAEGGHNAIHPELGTLEDFRALLAAAGAQGLEIAIDFAIQCAPDHPWITQHPEWFDWRPDGSIKYAENPPKKYQDIVNIDFYGPGRVPAVWEALRDVVLFWAAQGVKTFRVDNPHTKPLPFWGWMIAEVKARHPDAIFLAEAFTRPRPMYQLAKAGFTQSYTYFTWRNTKSELTDYLTELSTTAVKSFFRPHFFVNTPDINPYFLQTSGRAGFLIRAALAATLSGLFGVYAGFELCEAAALPGREEYLDSEKYEVRPRPERASGDIVGEIAQLNAIRRGEPALQTHLGVAFHNAFNDQVLYYSKGDASEGGLILVAVSLDPHHAQDADFEVPLWLFGLPDDAAVQVQNLLTGRRFRWTGKLQHLRLSPDDPYAIWRISPLEAAYP
jgi:starch synthase (maltosyl-transferring)